MKYVELGMSCIFNNTTDFRMVKITKGISRPQSKYRKARKTDWHWERYERKSDGKGFAIVRWREDAKGDPEFHVIQFCTLEGQLYLTEEVGPDLLGSEYSHDVLDGGGFGEQAEVDQAPTHAVEFRDQVGF